MRKDRSTPGRPLPFVIPDLIRNPLEGAALDGAATRPETLHPGKSAGLLCRITRTDKLRTHRQCSARYGPGSGKTVPVGAALSGWWKRGQGKAILNPTQVHNRVTLPRRNS
jgi:hypothetical protein